MTIDLPARHRRAHSIEFKTDLVTMCRQPEISVSAVALKHGVNANLLRRWIKQFSGEQPSQMVSAPAKLVPVQVDLPVKVPANDAIEINIQKNGTRINILWPSSQAKTCAKWMGEWIK